jgi:hypothetical protein
MAGNEALVSNKAALRFCYTDERSPYGMSRQSLSFFLLAGVIVLTLLAAATLVPYPSRMISDMGYYTLCPFAPWSTLTLLMLAGLGWVVRQYIQMQPR